MGYRNNDLGAPDSRADICHYEVCLIERNQKVLIYLHSLKRIFIENCQIMQDTTYTIIKQVKNQGKLN